MPPCFLSQPKSKDQSMICGTSKVGYIVSALWVITIIGLHMATRHGHLQGLVFQLGVLDALGIIQQEPTCLYGVTCTHTAWLHACTCGQVLRLLCCLARIPGFKCLPSIESTNSPLGPTFSSTCGCGSTRVCKTTSGYGRTVKPTPPHKCSYPFVVGIYMPLNLI